jgi:alkylation response protein AidB-like acyl-CoA dehydrogenase
LDFSIPAEYAELQKNLTGFVDRELRPLEEAQLDPEEDDIPVELRDRVRRRSAELGFYAADFPEDLGGSGLPQLGMALLREAAGWPASLPMAPRARPGFCCRVRTSRRRPT